MRGSIDCPGWRRGAGAPGRTSLRAACCLIAASLSSAAPEQHRMRAAGAARTAVAGKIVYWALVSGGRASRSYAPRTCSGLGTLSRRYPADLPRHEPRIVASSPVHAHAPTACGWRPHLSAAASRSFVWGGVRDGRRSKPMASAILRWAWRSTRASRCRFRADRSI